MQSPTSVAIYRLSILAMITFLFSFGLNAQGIVIKEKVTIGTKETSSGLIIPPEGLVPSLACVMPFDGGGILRIWGFDDIFDGDTRICLNGNTIIDDVYKQVYEIGVPGVELGHFNQGDNLTFTMIHASGSPWPIDLCWYDESYCETEYSLYFTNEPICRRAFDEGASFPMNVNVAIYLLRDKAASEEYLNSGWDGAEFVFGEPIMKVRP